MKQHGEATPHRSSDVKTNRKKGAVLVLGNYRPGLTTVRELYGLGYRVILGSEPGAFCVDYSRYVDEIWHSPAPVPDSNEYLDALQELIQREPDLNMILPINEATLNTIASFENVLKPKVRIASPSPAIISLCHDKYEWLKFLQKTGVGCPPFRVVQDTASLDEAIAVVGSPAVIRPIEAGTRFGFDKVLFVSDEVDRRKLLPDWPEGVAELLVQRRFVGNRYNIYFAAREGVVLREQHSACLRSASADGSGQTVEGITVHRIPKLSSDLEAVVRGLDYTGVGNAQFMYDPATNTSCFLEINPRFGASYALVESVGMELTRFAVELADGNASTPACETYDDDQGTRVTGLYTDLFGLGHAIRSSNVSPAGAAHWLGVAILAAMRANVHVTWSWRDPLPALSFPVYRAIGLIRRQLQSLKCRSN